MKSLMTVDNWPGLCIERHEVKNGLRTLQSWPPRDDFPIVVDAKGNVVCKFGDDVWDLSLWSRKPERISLKHSNVRIVEDGERRKKQEEAAAQNLQLIKRVLAFRLYGFRPVRSVTTLRSVLTSLRPLFDLCTENSIVASDFYRHLRIVEASISVISPSRAGDLIATLNLLWVNREALGFVIADEAAISTIASRVGRRAKIQTPFIPPRIWTYQVTRLKECLDDFIQHREQLEECYRFALNAYAFNSKQGKLASAFDEIERWHRPFDPTKRPQKILLSCKSREVVYHGPFMDVARRFGVADLLEKWTGANRRAEIHTLSSYLSLVSHAGLAYILNFSLMRIAEGESLRVSCIQIERDLNGQDIYLIKGVTTKTISDNDALWIVPRSVTTAVEAMTTIANLRIHVASQNPKHQMPTEDIEDPILLARGGEPWVPRCPVGQVVRKCTTSYSALAKWCPLLFDPKHLEITAEDLAVASPINGPMVETDFAIGKQWPLAWHQLRRTGAVNMLNSGMVSEASLSLQLKHMSRLMTRYYTNNHYQLSARLNGDTSDLYVKETYSNIARRFNSLDSSSYISPHGPKRKAQLLEPVSEKGAKKVEQMAAEGSIRCNQTFLGLCLSSEPCDKGGWSNISGCMGHGYEKPCDSVLIDARKRPVIVKLINVLSGQHMSASDGSIGKMALAAQLDSAGRALALIDESDHG